MWPPCKKSAQKTPPTQDTDSISLQASCLFALLFSFSLGVFGLLVAVLSVLLSV